MSEETEDFDGQKEKVMRFAKFAGFLLVIVILWYTFDIAGGV